MKILFSKKFNKQYHKADKKIQTAFSLRLQIFMKDPHNPRLRLHQLSGKFSDFQSINITGDWRALYSEQKDGDGSIILFEALGTHAQLYK